MRQYFYSGVVLKAGREGPGFYGLITVDGEGMLEPAEFVSIIQSITTKNTKSKSERILLRSFNLLGGQMTKEVGK